MSKNPKKDKKNPKQASLNEPSELSKEDYRNLIEQIQTEFSETECQGELIDAARYDDVDVVRAILKCHPDLCSFQDASNGNSALHMAAANGHVAIVELLLAHGADASLQNQAGNTPLHWAASNGKEQVVKLLLSSSSKSNCPQDVLLRNKFGRSALTEGFSSENTELVQSLLEHESATEERLMQSTTGDGDSDQKDSVTHAFLLGRARETAAVRLQVRELAIAKSDKDSILGQTSPEADTTGLGIWAASLVCAQWMVDRQDVFSDDNNDKKVVLELGAGCGVPGLAVAAAGSVHKVYLTDFNAQTVENLQHNVKLNELDNVQVLNMNWQDPSTWPKEKVDVVIGADLIYQSDMVPLLLKTIPSLLATGGRFLYAAPESGRQGQEEFFAALACHEGMDLISERMAPNEYCENPLENQDDEECFLHFNELKDSTITYKLFEFECLGVIDK